MERQLIVLDETGDSRHTWTDDDAASFVAVEAEFNKLFGGGGYLAYTTEADGGGGTVVNRIDQTDERVVLTPKLVGDQIGLHPVLVIFAVAAGGSLFGFFGILLALPAAAVLSVLVRFAYHRYLSEHPEIVVEQGDGR